MTVQQGYKQLSELALLRLFVSGMELPTPREASDTVSTSKERE